VKAEDELTCQLYATIPLGSLTAVQAMMNGSVTADPSDGETGDGAGGAAAAARPPAMRDTTMTNNNVKDRRADILDFIIPPMFDRIQRAIPRRGETVFVAKKLFRLTPAALTEPE
jgi:hypothetical protein